MQNSILIVFFLTGHQIFAESHNQEEVTPKGSEEAFDGDIKKFTDEFLQNLQGEFYLDPQLTERVGNYTLPIMKNGDWMLTNHPKALVESFTERTNVTASIFVKFENEFVRLSTSLKVQKIKEATGSVLEHSSPAYQNLINGKSFTGKVRVFGVEYLSHYAPIKNKKDEVIGAYYLGIPLPKSN